MSGIDPYFDKKIGDLRNLLGVQTSEELRECEPQIVFANELELESVNIPRTNNLDEILALHKQLFKGVYDWAGSIRTVDIKKEGGEYFLPVSKIRNATDHVFTELAAENFLQDLDIPNFIARLAYYYDQLNFIHPFREGNGRTQRVFWSRVSYDAGYAIDWDMVSENENNEASRIAAESMNRSMLEDMLERISSPITK